MGVGDRQAVGGRRRPQPPGPRGGSSPFAARSRSVRRHPAVDLVAEGEDDLAALPAEAVDGQAVELLPALDGARALPQVEGDLLPAVQSPGLGLEGGAHRRGRSIARRAPAPHDAILPWRGMSLAAAARTATDPWWEAGRVSVETDWSTRMRGQELHHRRLLTPSLTPAVVTTRGRRETNQDRVCALRTLVGGEPAVLLAVADGIGGLPAGEQAADLALQVVGHYAHYVIPDLGADAVALRAGSPSSFGRRAAGSGCGRGTTVSRHRRQHARLRPRLGAPLPRGPRRGQPLLLRERPGSEPH